MTDSVSVKVKAKSDAVSKMPVTAHVESKRIVRDGMPSAQGVQSLPNINNIHVMQNKDTASRPASTISVGRSSRFNAPTAMSDGISSPNKSTALSGSSIVCSSERERTPLARVRVVATGVPEMTNSLSNRRMAEATRQKLQEFFKPMMLPPETQATKKMRGAPSVWLLSIALSCSYISGVRITVEDVLRQNRLSLHYLSLPSVTLAELFDISNEFVENHNKLREMKLHCDVTTFDAETVNELDDVVGTGERLPIMSLSQFRKELSSINERSIYIMNFDPYLIEQHEIQMQFNKMELHEMDGVNKEVTPRWMVKNQGGFALFLGFNSALHLVTLGVPFFMEDAKIAIEQQNVPIQTLYKALCVKDNYSNRSRGFVRIFFSDEFTKNVSSIFPLSILDGSSSGGLLTTALDTSISPHILGLSLMHHLVTSTLIEKSYQQQHQQQQIVTSLCEVNLRGIPVTKLCQTLNLGIATIVGGSVKASVPMAFSWYKTFLKRLNIDDMVALGVVLPARRDGAEDGPVNITEEVFMSHMELAVNTKSVVLIGFDVNIALNVKVDNRPEPCHFAILIGLDRGRGIARLADVNVKKYRKTWHVPVTRLYYSVIGYGYMMVAKSQVTISELRSERFAESILHEARYSLPPTKCLMRFEYPKKNYVMTVLADAFDRLGFYTDVETVMNFSGFHLSFMLSERLSLESAATVARNFSHSRTNDSVSVLTTHMDEGKAQFTQQAFLKQIRTAIQNPKESCLIVNFQSSLLHSNKAVWNGSNGGSYAIVLGYDEANSLVTLSDANHESFYRAWVCPLDVLFAIVSAIDPVALRACGTILLTATSQHDNYVDTYGYDMCHTLVYHPFKPSVWPGLQCLALVASEMATNCCNADVISMADRAVQFSAEDFLYTTSSFSIPSMILGSELRGDRIACLANMTFARLQIPLKANVVDIAAAESFLKACRDTVVNGKPTTMTVIGYDTQLVHGVAGFSAGVINRVRMNAGGSIQIVEGNSCAFGSIWELSADKLRRAVTSMVRIRRK